MKYKYIIFYPFYISRSAPNIYTFKNTMQGLPCSRGLKTELPIHGALARSLVTKLRSCMLPPTPTLCGEKKNPQNHAYESYIVRGKKNPTSM